jgi:arylsulfatase A-like enzyme
MKIKTLASSLLVGTSMMSFSKEKPNFVIILADDLGYADVGFTGSTQIKTPNIDRIANNGVTFTQGYVTSAVSSPSRAGLLTGMNQVSFGHDNNIGGNQKGFDKKFLGLPTDIKTIAERLHEYNYVNGIVGKWHLGEEKQHLPENRGFDQYWYYPGGGHDYFKYDKSLKHGYNGRIYSNMTKDIGVSYITDDKGKQCCNFIEDNKDENFFLFASFNAPHAPLQATKADLKLFSHIKDKRRRTYLAMIHRLDVNVGRIVKTLKETGVYENTVIFFLSDNGGPCDSNASINAPFRGQKGILLEGGIHVPFALSYPKEIKSPKVYKNLVSSFDIASTMLALANNGIESKELHGKNLIPFVTNKKLGVPHEDLKWKFTISASIRKGDWKLVRIPDRLPMLYNLKDDVAEQNNLLFQNREIATQLLKQLGDWDVSLPHPVFLEGARWKKFQLDLYDKKYKLMQPK